MKTAIYARKSTDDDRSTDNKSVTRQVERACAYAADNGWTVEDEHIYIDDGISGAEFKNRPALLRLLNDLKEFDVIVTSELSRLGREQAQTASVLANIYAKGRRVYFYLTDEEVKFDSAIDKFLVGAVSFAAEMEREKASQRSRDALSRKASKGYNTGGVVYGYDNAVIEATNANGEQVKSHTEYRINEEQAEVIRTIFKMYADGYGFVTIAKILNGDPRQADRTEKYLGGALPASPRKGTGSWAPSSVRAIIINERYKGKIPFGKLRKAYRGGTKVRVKQDEYKLIDAPHLCVVPAELWDAAHARLAAATKTYLRDTKGQLWGRPGMGRESKYLLTGLGRCAICGANLQIIGGRSGTRPCYYYGCSYHHNRGATVCANDHKERMETLDDAVLTAIEEQVLTADVVTAGVEKALKLISEQHRQEPNREKQLQGELRQLRKELDRLVVLVVAGKAPERVLVEIKTREARIKALELELAQAQHGDGDDLDLPRLKKALQERAARFKDLIYSDVPMARQALRKILGNEPLKISPVVRGGRKTFSFEGRTRVGALLEPGYLGMASPRGFEPLLPP